MFYSDKVVVQCMEGYLPVTKPRAWVTQYETGCEKSYYTRRSEATILKIVIPKGHYHFSELLATSTSLLVKTLEVYDACTVQFSRKAINDFRLAVDEEYLKSNVYMDIIKTSSDGILTATFDCDTKVSISADCIQLYQGMRPTPSKF